MSERPRSGDSYQRAETSRPHSDEPAPSAPGAAASIAARVIARHAELDRLNHFQLLELPETADRETIVAAFQRSVRSYHPDLLRGDNEHLRPLAQEIFCRIGSAYKVLANDAARQQYVFGLKRSPSMPGLRSSLPDVPPGVNGSRPSMASLRPSLQAPRCSLPPGWTAENACEAARIHMKRGAVKEATTFAQQACDADPKNLEYRALHAWLRVLNGELRPGPRADEILAILTRALRNQRHNLEIRMYRARVLQRLGRMEEAIRDFSVVASMDERNLEAVREVRIYRMRAEQKAASSGVFAKLFSR